MKRIYALLMIMFVFSSFIQAQDVLDKVSDETCECIEKKVKGKMDSDQLTMVLGLCMLDASSGYKKEIKKKYKIDLTNENEFTEFGEILGERLATRCDKFMEIVFEMMSDDESEIGNEIKKELYEEIGVEEVDEVIEANSPNQRTAEILEIKEGNILLLKCKIDGKLVDVYCIEEFDGAENLKDLAGLKNNSFNITTVEKSIYSPELKTFITVETLTSIDK